MVGDCQFVTQRYIWWVGATKLVILALRNYELLYTDLFFHRLKKTLREIKFPSDMIPSDHAIMLKLSVTS